MSKSPPPLAIMIAGGAIALLASAFLVGSTPDEEEFRFAVLSTWLHVDALRDGQLAFWTDRLGLGVPQPFIPNFLLHPLSPLLAVLPPIAWVRVLLAAHTLLGAAGAWFLMQRLGATPLTRAVCVATFLLAAPAQNYVLVDFWPSHFIVWTSAPWLLLLAWRALEADGPPLRRQCVALGLAGGLVLAATNPGHAIVYGTVVLAVVATRWRAVVARGPWLALAAVMALALTGPTLVRLWHEQPLFAPGLPLANLPDPLPWWAALTAFLSPLGSADNDWRVARMLYFGGPFAALSVAGCVMFRRRHPDLVLIVAGCTLLLFTPLLPLPFISARYHLRDPLTLAAIPLAGLALDRWIASSRWRTAAFATVAVQLAVITAVAWPALTRTWSADARRAEWFAGATGAAASADQIVSLMAAPGRLLFSPAVDAAVYEGQRYREGLGVNALAYRGVHVVNAWSKAASTATVSPDERLLYGRIQTPPPLMMSPATLDVLGIRYVLADEGEDVAADLWQLGTAPKGSGERLVIYENIDAWPAAFTADAGSESMTMPRLPGCAHDRLLCRDLGGWGSRRLPATVELSGGNGAIDVQLADAATPRLLVVTQMFRPEWQASADGVPLTTVSVSGGLLGVRLPAGITGAQLRYRPLGVIAATALAWATLIGAAVILLAPTRGWWRNQRARFRARRQSD